MTSLTFCAPFLSTAHAGINRTCIPSVQRPRNLPRTRGDKPVSVFVRQRPSASTAHAGINRTKVLNISQILHLPHTRG